MYKEEKAKMLKKVNDPRIIECLYLDLSIDQLIDKLDSLELVDIGNEKEVPFTAKLRDYLGAKDKDGNNWLIKKITEEEVYIHKIQEVAYYMDFLMNTLAAPTIVKKIGNEFYRTTKIVSGAMQVGSYNYLERPFIGILGNDLINRWLFYDEDRNPNNYMVMHNRKEIPFIVVIDYNKADLWSKGMKIKGIDDKFGWQRKEKTRFLTLLKPENFENFSIEDFDTKLKLMMDISQDTIHDICLKIFKGYLVDPKETSDLVTNNLVERRTYINDYFRKWFKKKDLEKEKAEDDRYSGFGKSFMDYYKDKK